MNNTIKDYKNCIKNFVSQVETVFIHPSVSKCAKIYCALYVKDFKTVSVSEC